MIKSLVRAATFDQPGLNWLVAGVVVCVSVTFGVTGYSFMSAKAAGVRLYLTPAKANLTVGSTITVDVRADSLGSTVNAAQINVDYPASKLRYDGFDAQGGSFEVQANTNDATGIVRIARGTTTPVNGDFKILSLRFTAVGTGKAQVHVDPSSALVNSSSSTNILAGYGVANYSIRK